MGSYLKQYQTFIKALAFAALLMPIVCLAQTTGTTAISIDGGGSQHANCTEIIQFDNFNNSAALSATGENFVITLLNGFKLYFNVKATGVGMTPVAPPAFVNAGTPSAFGGYGYTGLPGKPILYAAGYGGYNHILFSNIHLQDRLGNPVTNFTMVIMDGEQTAISETITYSSNATWYYWDSITPSVTYNSPYVNGVGTDTVICAAHLPNATGYVAYGFAVDAPSTINLDFYDGSAGKEGIAVGIKRIIVGQRDSICSSQSITMHPINAPTSVSYTWALPTITGGNVTGATIDTVGTNTITQTLTNTGNTIATVIYTITPTICGLQGNTFTDTIVVLPNLSAGANQTVCLNGDTLLQAIGNGTWSQLTTNPTTATIADVNANNSRVSGFTTIGSYGFVWINTHGCSDTTYITVSPSPTVDILPSNNTICAGASATLTATPSTIGGIYLWSPTGDTTATINVSPSAVTNYVVTYTTPNCPSATDTAIVSLYPTISHSIIADSVACNGGNNGNIILIASGGTPPYAYAINGGAYQPTDTFSGLSAGVYGLAIVDINNCKDTLSQTIYQPSPLTLNLTTSGGCNDDSTFGRIVANVGGGNLPYLYAINNGVQQSSNTFNNLTPGQYSVSVEDSKGCTVMDTTIVSESSSSTLSVTPMIDSVVFGNSITLVSHYNSSDTAQIQYAWTPSDGLNCTDCASPTALPLTTTTYLLSVTNSLGCVDTAYATIYVNQNQKVLYIPNAFTPNGDGKNDLFFIYGYGFDHINLKIFDRWGELVFQTTDAHQGWDGTFKGQVLPPNVFVYLVKVSYLDGSETIRKGSLTLIR